MLNIGRYLPRLGLGVAVACATAALLAQPASAAGRCLLSPDDLQSLQTSKSGLKDQAEVDALPAAKQQMVCSTRALWKRVHSAGDQLPKSWPDDEPGFSPAFMSPDELHTFDRLEDAWVDAQMAADEARQASKFGKAASAKASTAKPH